MSFENTHAISDHLRAGETGLSAFPAAFPPSGARSRLSAWSGVFCFFGFSYSMEAFDSSSTFKSRSGTLATFRDLLQTSLPMEQIHLRLTSEDDLEPDPSSDSYEEKEEFLNNDEEESLGPELSTVDEEKEQSEVVKDSDSSSTTDEADGLEQLTLDSGPEPPLNKPIRSYLDETLPDLLKSGSPLRRRVSSPVSNTLKQVRREVELSRRRSLKIKAQVDKLQEQSQDGLAWNQQRERVTEDIQSIVKLLLPLTDLESITSLSQGSTLDTALLQLQNVARTLALNHTDHKKAKGGKANNDAVILQQALRDRDEALEKKKAMETELLKSKTEMMTLNNQLLEAVQRRLELAIELEAWKDDMQVILQHQLQQQQLAEQAQRKSKVFGGLRRSKPQPSPVQAPAPSQATTTSISQLPNTPVAQRWKERLQRRRTTSSPIEQQANSGFLEPQSPGISSKSIREESFQTVSLD